MIKLNIVFTSWWCACIWCVIDRLWRACDFMVRLVSCSMVFSSCLFSAMGVVSSVSVMSWSVSRAVRMFVCIV